MRLRAEAPSSPFPPDKLAAGVERLARAGNVFDDVSPLLRGTHAYLNGDDATRLRCLEEGLRSAAHVPWLARGG
jgi:hypothetical protein